MGNLLYSCVRLSFGTIYPAYRSFKAVKTRDIKEYVHWMTYWIVLTMVTLSEDLTDLLFGPWLPLYFEAKTLFLVWLASPSTRGSVILYTRIIHPFLVGKEDAIDRMMKNMMDQSYILGLRYSRAAAKSVSTIVLRTAIVGGGGLVKRIRQSYSMHEIGGKQKTGDEIEVCGIDRDMGMKIRSSVELNELRMLEDEMRPFLLSDRSRNSHYKTEYCKYKNSTKLTQRKQDFNVRKTKATNHTTIKSKSIKQNSKQSAVKTFTQRKHSLSKIDENLFEDEEEFREHTRRTV